MVIIFFCIGWLIGDWVQSYNLNKKQWECVESFIIDNNAECNIYKRIQK